MPYALGSGLTMFTVALIGPDGAGKTTVARELERVLAIPAKYVYMGVNWEASNHLLPTTRLVQRIRRLAGGERPSGGRPPSRSARPTGGPLARRMRRNAWRTLSLANRLGEEWYRQLLAWSYVLRGTIVIFDRHFFPDYHAHDIAGKRPRTLDRRIHGFLLRRVYPKPSLVVYLDAPSDVLLARKGEGTRESLEQRRHEYLDLAGEVRRFVRVDASRPLDDVVRDVAEIVEAFAAERDDEQHVGTIRG
jgi:thymidylate kinase